VRDAVHLLLSAWDVTSALDAGIDDDRSSSQAHFAVRVRVRARRALERIHKAVPHDVLEDLVGFWSRRCRQVSRPGPDELSSAPEALTKLVLSRRTS